MRRAASLVALALAASCGGAPATPMVDASAGSSLQAHCPPPPGLAFFGDSLAISNAPGFDLNGDGVPDNELGFLGPVENASVANGIATGGLVFLVTVDDTAPGPRRIAMWSASDGDNDPSDNTMLGSPFRIPDDQFDVSCQSRSLVTLSDDGTTVIGHADAGALRLGAGVADLDLYQVLVHLTVSADRTQMSADMGAAWSACALLQAASGVAGYSGLELILQLKPGIQPDVDSQGHPATGRIALAGTHQFTCTPASGPAVTSATCPCDLLADQGYSMFVHLHGVQAQILPSEGSP